MMFLSQDMTRIEAIKAAVEKYPHLHEDFIRRAQEDTVKIPEDYRR